MPYLSHYTEQAQTDLFNKMGAFFAFSQDQFDERKIEGVVYTSMMAGLVCPKNNADALFQELDNIIQSGIASDIAANGLKKIIHRELANHEAQISMDIESTVHALSGYPGITRETIQAEWREFFQHCIDNDYF